MDSFSKRIVVKLIFIISLAFISIVLACLPFFLPKAHGASYHFASNGNDTTGDGSANNPYLTINKLNSINYTSGDIINLRFGDTFDDTRLDLNSTTGTVSGLTIQGAAFGGRDEADGKPLIDGDSYQPIVISDDAGSANGATISDLVIKDIDISGQEWADTKSTNLYLNDIDGILIDGVDFDGEGGSSADTSNTNQIGKNGIQIAGDNSGNIEIKNCNLQNGGKYGFGGTDDIVGLIVWYLGADAGKTVLIHHNTICNWQTDCIQNQQNNRVVQIYNNTLCNGGENKIDIKDNDNGLIYNNVIYQEENFPVGGSSIAGLIAPCIVVHDDALQLSADNNKIYDNIFYLINGGSNAAAYDPHIILSRSNDSTEITGNYFYDCEVGVKIDNYTTNLKLHHNLFRDCGTGSQPAIDINGTTSVDNNEVTNNTIIQNSGTIDEGIKGDGPSGAGATEISKNITVLNNAVDGYPYDSEGGSNAVIDGNCWFNNVGGVFTDRGGVEYEKADVATWNGLTGVGDTIEDIFDDPLFDNEGGTAQEDYEIDPESPCKSEGKAWGSEGFVGLPPPEGDSVINTVRGNFRMGNVLVPQTPTYIQSDWDETQSQLQSTSITLNGVAAGSLLVGTSRISDPANVVCSDDKGGSWTTHFNVDSELGWKQAVCSSPDAAGGNTQITFTSQGSADFWRVQVSEFSNVAISDYTIDTSTGSGSVSNPVTGNVTTTQTNTLLYASAASDGDGWNCEGSCSCVTITTDFTCMENAGKKNVSGYRVVNSGTYSATFNNSPDWTAGIVAFKPLIN